MNLDYKNELDPHQDLTKTNSKEETALATNGPRTNSIVDGEGRPVNGGKDDLLPVLETAEEKRMRKRSHYVVYMTCFIMSLGFSIVLTGVWPYMKELDPDASKEFLGWVVAANPFGQMIASPILGWVGNKMGSTRVPFIVTILLFIVGNVLYAILPLTRPYSDYFIVLSRLIVGISAANVAICRSYAVSSSKLQERTTTLSIMAAAQSLGFILGPSIQSGVAYAFPPQNLTLSESQDHDFAVMNMYSIPAWFCLILGLLNMILFTPWIFKEFNIIARERSLSSAFNRLPLPPPDYLALFVISFAFFILQTCLILIETILVPLFMDLYAWSPEHAIFIAGIILCVLAFFAMVCFALTAYLSKRFDERKILLLGFIPITLGMLILFPFGGNYPEIQDCSPLPEPDLSNDVIHDPCFSFSNCSTLEHLNRSRRSLVTSTNSTICSLGCPRIQKWCLTTPIIEIPQILVGFFLIFIGYSFAFAISQSLISKIFGPRPQGTTMGIITSLGSFSRILGPIAVSYIYLFFGTRWLIGSFSAVMFFMILLIALFFKRFVALKMDPNEDSDEALSGTKPKQTKNEL